MYIKHGIFQNKMIIQKQTGEFKFEQMSNCDDFDENINNRGRVIWL